MGVKSCSRSNCDSIMCDTYIPTIGYVCVSCQNDFKHFLRRNFITYYSFNEDDIIKDLKVFMDSPVNRDDNTDNTETYIYKFFSHFTDGNDF